MTDLLDSARHQFLGQILEDSVNEIYIFDADTLRFTLVNMGARENLGYDSEEMRALTAVDIKPDFDKAQFEEVISPLRKGEQKQLVFETRHQRKDGSCYDVEVRLQLKDRESERYFVAIILDVTERKRAEEMLGIQEAAINASENGIIIADATQEDQPIIFANPTVLKMTGYSESEMLGRNCRFLQGEDVGQPEIAEVRAAVREGKGCRVVLRNYRKDGSLFWNELSISPVRDKTGKLTHFIGIQQNVSKQRQAEEALRQLNSELDDRVQERTKQLEDAQEQLLRSEKLSTLGQLAGSVAHEIRTPLGVIRNAAYYLEATAVNPDEDALASFEEVKRGLASATNIFEELLDYAREPQVERTVFAIGDVIDHAFMGMKSPSGVTFVRDHDAEKGVTAAGDSQQISRILRNLIENAGQAMPEGGEVRIHCRLAAAENEVVIEVADQGGGIAEDQLSKIFEPLFSTKAKGIGLGLALSHRYAKLNDGELMVESELGSGSTFRLVIPGN